jgi:TIR domain-containing protein
MHMVERGKYPVEVAAEEDHVTARVFINYRSCDAGWAVHLDKALATRFGGEAVFRASRSIRPSEDYIDRILSAVGGAQLLVAVIGPTWVAAEDGNGDRALDRDADWVRREIAHALRSRIRVLPVLVDATRPLEASALPDDIGQLARCQYVRLSYRTAEADVRHLVDEIQKLVPDMTPISVEPMHAGRLHFLLSSHKSKLIAAATLSALACAIAFVSTIGNDHSSKGANLAGAQQDAHLPHAPAAMSSREYQVSTQQGESRPTFSSFLTYYDKGQSIPGGAWVQIACRWPHASESPSVGDWWYLVTQTPWNGRWIVSNSYITRTKESGRVTHRYDGRTDPDVDMTVPLCEK